VTSADGRANGVGARAPILAGVLLFGVYVATLAPGATFWDAGEFIAAVHTFGIPHPPGTPLFVLAARAWRLLFGFLPTALATNLFSAACTATACALTGVVVARRTGRSFAAATGVFCAGTMSSVWLNATETEVYSSSLLLAALMLWTGSRAEESGEGRWCVLLAFLIALAAPLHASALVAAPAAIALATGWVSTVPGDRLRVRGVGLMLTFVAAAGFATGHWIVAGCGAAALLVGALRKPQARRFLLVLLLGVSPLVVMLVRARLDPAINQGNPANFDALFGVIARRQYAVAAPWPRQAPLWLQFGNLLEYVDWQVALGLAPGPAPHVLRTPFTILFLALGWLGARRLRRDAVAAWRTLLLLVACASLGVLLYLNLKAGPSLGCTIPRSFCRWIQGILPESAPHEARERDYFFVLAFWGWGLLAGYGAVRIAEDARRLPAFLSSGRGRSMLGGLLAMLPLLLNWRAVDRRREPDASAPERLAGALLGSAPDRALLFVWGDNDTYPLWFAQQALGTRPDVRVVTISLLAAPWYRAELERRDSLVVGPWRGQLAAIASLAVAARDRGRPVTFAATVPATTRNASGGSWELCGAVWMETGYRCAFAGTQSIDAWLANNPVSDVTDPTTISMLQPLRCPGLKARSKTSAAAADSLDSVCNAK
jgi:hypothetical protein